MVAGLPTDEPVTVVELGPGTGAFTGAIVERHRTRTRGSWPIDLEPTFVEKIRERWPTVECVCASAEQLEALVADRGTRPVDHIISGLPFASLPVADDAPDPRRRRAHAAARRHVHDVSVRARLRHAAGATVPPGDERSGWADPPIAGSC